MYLHQPLDIRTTETLLHLIPRGSNFAVQSLVRSEHNACLDISQVMWRLRMSWSDFRRRYVDAFVGRAIARRHQHFNERQFEKNGLSTTSGRYICFRVGDDVLLLSVVPLTT